MAVRVPLSPALSYTSLELAHILDNASLPPLLSESCPLSSTSTSESTLATIPSFPSGHGPPSRFPLVAFNETGLLHSELVLISVPTPPRLKGVLEEHLSVRKWATTLDPSMAPGHVPWSDLEDTAEPSIWMPEGSVQSPRVFGLASSNTRIPSLLGCRPEPLRTNSAPASSPPKKQVDRRASLHNTMLHRKSFRNAQVFEQEITLNTGGTTQRWSMDIPSNAVLPGTVDLVLNLTKSSSSKRVEQLVTSASCSHILADQPSLPQDALEDLVNDGASDNFDRLPSDPSVNLDSFPQVPTLATRRGHQELPRLMLQSHPLLTSPYPDLPTAFIGTPSYTPNDTVEIASVQTDSLPLHAMITNLRERCRSLVPRTPVDTVEHSLSRPIPVDQQNPSAEHDEWAFAADLMTPLCPCTDVLNRDGQISSNKPAIPEESHPSCPRTTSPHSSVGSPPPRSSLPSCPPALPGSPNPSVKGILKGRKSVRFASLPTRSGSIPLNQSFRNENLPPPKERTASKFVKPKLVPRHSTGSTAVSSPRPCERRRPSLPAEVRGRYSPSNKPPLSFNQNNSQMIPLKPSSLPRAQDSPVRSKDIRLSASTQRGSNSSNPSPARPPRPRPNAEGLTSGRSIPTPTRVPSPAKRMSVSQGSAQLVKAAISRRRSIFGLSQVNADDNSRRGTESEVDHRASKMPVPLKNILTRFK